ncbi:MAG: electron transport complex subunit RsxG [Gammaproteobacteria bacterium]|nr:electron transport complex subunit RsxG [Gammaproteobacteria bacterium]
MIKHPIVTAGIILFLFAVAGVGLVALIHVLTAERILDNEHQALLQKLNALVPAETIDNDIVGDVVTVHAPEALGIPENRVHLGRLAGKPVAAVFTSVVPNGYAGRINLLVAVRVDGTLGGVRVVSHKETPGLGDKIEEEKSDWIYSFNGRSLGDPEIGKWKVKKDGGVFDQFTGATVTPRNVVAAVKSTLIYFRDHGDRLFQQAER